MNGVPLTDFQEVTGSVERWEDWCSAWSARAAVHEELGNKSHAEGFKLSAGEHWTRAAVCYHFGKFLFVNDMAQLKEAHRKSVECRNRALPLLRPPGERVAIPTKANSFTAICASPPASTRRRRRHVHGPRFGERGNGRLREPVPEARSRDARVRRAGTGRSRIRFSHLSRV